MTVTHHIKQGLRSSMTHNRRMIACLLYRIAVFLFLYFSLTGYATLLPCWGQTSDGKNRLQQAVVEGDVKYLTALLNSHDSPPTRIELSEALIAASGKGSEEAVKILLSHKADPNASFSLMGFVTTALITAIREDRPGVVDILLKNGADPNKANTFDWKPIHHAILPRKASLPVIELLLKSGADINAKDSLQRTPLHRAAMYGHFQAAKLLLAHGANPRLVDHRGKTPAERASNVEIRNLLLHGNEK